MIFKFAVILGTAAMVHPLVAQAPPSDQARPRVVATRSAGRLDIDGRLTEPEWQGGSVARGFVQREPTEGAAAPEDTEVRFIVTADALIIGARMHSRNPAGLRPLIARRDHGVPSEQLRVSLDTRRDRVTAYTFSVTVGGVRSDDFHPSDNEGSQDESYDPVWQAATAIDSAGWTAEFRIPFTQLRFDASDDLEFGLNIVRVVPDRNERTYWTLVRRSETGWSSRMGALTGLGALRTPRRLEFVPYVAAEGTRFDEFDRDDPFSARTDTRIRAGADVKVGLGQSLTLDATINPDFGQVEADPAVVNLTAFEIGFDERRPFFLEGSNLIGGRNTFYSRRIGAAPPGSADAPFSEEAGNSTILGAAKITGRLPSGLSLGGLTALTARERIRTFDPETGQFGSTVVAPLTAFSVITAQQELGRDRSTLKASLTGVERDLEGGSPLAALLARRAYTGLVDGRWRWAGGAYDISAYAIYSHIEGDSLAIQRQQRSSRRYFQRPDADHVKYDPSRTSMNGFAAAIGHSKMAGHWLWDVDYGYWSPTLELNDIGFQNSVDDHLASGNLRYRHTTPGKVFHRWLAGVEAAGRWNGGGVRNSAELSAAGEFVWRNFWSTDVQVTHAPRSLDDAITRGGPLMLTPRRSVVEIDIENEDGATTGLSLSGSASRDELDGWGVEVGAGISLRPGTRWELTLEPTFFRGRTARQYAGTRLGGPEATYGSRYLFAEVERSEIALQMRVNFSITPDLTLEGYFEPFASSGRYSNLGELVAARGFDIRRYGTDGTQLTRTADGDLAVSDGGASFVVQNPDFNVRSFRSNVVLRWEWVPGSTAYLVWQQDRFEERARIATVQPAGLLQAFGAPGTNVLAIKVSYWLAK